MRNAVKTAVLLAALGALFMARRRRLRRQRGLVIGLALGLVFVGGSYWFSDTPRDQGGRAEPVTEEELPEVYAIVEDLTQRAGMPMPKLYVSPDDAAQRLRHRPQPAPRGGGVTQGILQVLDRDELRGVLAHELVARRATATSSSARSPRRSRWASPSSPAWRCGARSSAVAATATAATRSARSP